MSTSKAIAAAEGQRFSYMGVLHEMRDGVPVKVAEEVKQYRGVRWITLADATRVYGHPRLLLFRMVREKAIRHQRRPVRGAIPSYFLCVEDLAAWANSERGQTVQGMRKVSQMAEPLGIISTSIDAIIAHAHKRQSKAAKKNQARLRAKRERNA